MSAENPIICRGRAITADAGPFIFGILNVTPDSFSDGGDHERHDSAVAAGLQLAADGADVIDVGGESTRPGSELVTAAEQIRRTRDVIARLAKRFGPDGPAISIDTRNAEVAEAALDAGAIIVNDVSALRDDAELAGLIARRDAGVILMHMLGTPRTMQMEPHYDDVVGEISAFLSERAARAQRTGIASERIIVDPGLGFGKTVDHNLAILAHADAFTASGYPVLIGPSRKGLLGSVLGIADPKHRDVATAHVVVACILKGVQCVRVHNVALCRDAVRLAVALRRGHQ